MAPATNRDQPSIILSTAFAARNDAAGLRLWAWLITTGLAEAVAPGLTVGLDLARGQVVKARTLAAGRGLISLDHLAGDIYRLPFAEASLDAVFAHNLLEHLTSPLAALREMRRVLKPGGIVAVRDPDFGTGFWEPATPLLQEASKLMLRIREHNGGNPYYARHLRQLLVAAGFDYVEAFAFAEWQGSNAVTIAYGRVAAEVLRESQSVALAIEKGWADGESIEAMAAEIIAWSERADAFRALIDCAAIGWAPPVS